MDRTRILTSPAKSSWVQAILSCHHVLHSYPTVVKVISNWPVDRQTNQKSSCYYTLTWFAESGASARNSAEQVCGNVGSQKSMSLEYVWVINIFAVNIIIPCNKTLGCGIFYSTIMCCHLPDIATFILTSWTFLKLLNRPPFQVKGCFLLQVHWQDCEISEDWEKRYFAGYWSFCWSFNKHNTCCFLKCV